MIDVEHRPLEALEGVEPSTDNTAFETKHYTSSSNVRFVNGNPRKIGGNASIDFDDNNTISGKPRNIYGSQIDGKIRHIIGTHQKLYSLFGTTLTNITPLKTSTTAIADSLDSHYDTLGSDPIATTNGSADIVVTDSEASLFEEGDTYTLSGASDTNGITAAQINSDHVIRNISGTSITLTTGGTATSTGSGGGASVVRSSGLVTVNATSHGQANGDRVKIDGAADFGGFTASSEINIEHIIRNVSDNAFDIMTAGTATSSVTGDGGGSTTYQKEIDDGAADEAYGQGYGAGLYGVGLYGASGISSSNRVFARTWFCDKFGANIIGTPGEQTGLYSWDGDTTVAPTLVSNAPTAINYAFVSNNIVVTFGKTNENRVATSDQGSLTTWSATSTNKVFEDDLEGVGRLLSHAPVPGMNLIFTEKQTLSMRFIDSPLIWEFKTVDSTIGLIGPMARVVVKGVAYWMGLDNFYMWRGGNVEVIPSNSSRETTILRYVFDDINLSQKSKFFAWYNEEFQEIWFHYCSSGSNEPDRVAVFSLLTFAWWPLDLSRTAANYPDTILTKPLLINSSGNLYRHEYGLNDDGSALSWSFKTPLRYSGRDQAKIRGIIPDSIQNEDITATLTTYDWPEDVARYTESYTISDSAKRIATRVCGRYWQYEFSGSAVGQNFIMGEWLEEVVRGSRQ